MRRRVIVSLGLVALAAAAAGAVLAALGTSDPPSVAPISVERSPQPQAGDPGRDRAGSPADRPRARERRDRRDRRSSGDATPAGSAFSPPPTQAAAAPPPAPADAGGGERDDDSGDDSGDRDDDESEDDGDDD